MHEVIQRVNKAITALQQGKIVILADDIDRENEGDMVLAAEFINEDKMNFMIRQGSGIVCLSLTESKVKQLGLSLMVPQQDNSSMHRTPFTISIDARDGTSGVSAADRARTVQAAIASNATPNDIVFPGHIFPLQAKAGGVIERQGHTEGSIDLMRLAHLSDAAVICEVMNPDGSMTRGKQLKAFAEEHQLQVLSIEDIVTYRYLHENLIADQATTMLPLAQHGVFKVTAIKESITHAEHLVLSKPKLNKKATLVRVHSACTTGDLFVSQRCDCKDELQYSLDRISAEGGILIYLNQEGRGIGLLNKIKAYALQDQGLDTVDANKKLGLPVDSRNYHIAANILRNLGVAQIRLLTNNPRKIYELQKYGIAKVKQEVIPVYANEHNHYYLKTKKERLNHTIVF